MGDGRGPKLALLELTEVERETLRAWARRGKTAQALAVRARIVLACAGGLSNSEVSRQLGVSLPTVGKWRARFVADRLDGLGDEPRPGAPRKITDAQVEMVIVKTLEEAPDNHDSHWSTRSMARAVGLNQTAVSRIWRAFGLKPHLVDTWKLSTDPLFIDKICDNYATHKTPAIKTWLAAHPRFHLHFTPTSGSWLNMVERWFAELTNRKLRRSTHRSVKALEDDVNAWIAAWNEDPKPFVWTKTADEILANLATYCNRINKAFNDSAH